MTNRHRLLTTAGLDERRLAAIGAIGVLASHTEHYAERAIWAVEGKPVKGTKPTTNKMAISQMISTLEKLGALSPREELGKLIEEWCRASRPCFSCRNSILHGRTAYMDKEWTVFGRNEPVEGVIRSREAADFHASSHTLGLLEEAFSHLLNGIHFIWTAAQAPLPIGDTSPLRKQLRRAWSIGAELDDLAAAVMNEKY